MYDEIAVFVAGVQLMGAIASSAEFESVGPFNRWILSVTPLLHMIATFVFEGIAASILADLQLSAIYY